MVFGKSMCGKEFNSFVRFEFVAAVSDMFTVLWDVTLCSLVIGDGGGRFPRNVPHYLGSYKRRLESLIINVVPVYFEIQVLIGPWKWLCKLLMLLEGRNERLFPVTAAN
jgi:hypothetical protein